MAFITVDQPDCARLASMKGSVLLWRVWRSSPFSTALLRMGPRSDHGSLRGRHVPPHDGVGSVGLVMSTARSSRSMDQGRNGTHAMANTPSRRGTPFRPLGGSPAVLSLAHAGCASRADQRNSLPSRSMRCRMTESLRATATVAFLVPILFASRVPQAFSADQRGTRWRIIAGRLVQVGAQQLVAAAGDVAGVVLLAGLVAPRRQADVGPDAGRRGEALRRSSTTLT